MELTVRPLNPDTWEPYAALIDRHGGVWGGCWCMGFHSEGFSGSSEGHRVAKEARVRAGTAHAALVFDGGTCLGWCQYGPATDLTRIKHRKAWEAGGGVVPDWRITCFFVDKAARGQGVAEMALNGAVDLIAAAGGGVVESMPEEALGRKVSGSFLFNAELAMFERAGFEKVRKLGKWAWLVRRSIFAVGQETCA